MAASAALGPAASAETEIATFAGGCFWCVESDFDHVPGVVETVSGYTGGTSENPTYKNHHGAGHREAVQITFDPSVVTYEELLHSFWRSVDPTDGGGQFCDRGHSYTTAIYANGPDQLAQAQQSKSELEESGKLKQPIATAVEPAGAFWPAEDYHQDYYEKSAISYKFYRFGCRRDSRIQDLWGEEAHAGIADH